MKKHIYHLLIQVLILFTLKIPIAAAAAGNFIEIKLPKGVSVELPKSWKILSSQKIINLDTFAEALVNLSGSEQVNSKFPFAANYYNENHITTALANVRYYPDMNFSQKDVLALNAADVRDFDLEIKNALVQALKAGGISIASWKGTRKVNINGIIVLLTEYRRNPIKFKGIFRVRLVRVIAKERSFTLTVSYRELDDEMLLRVITNRVISSLKMK